MKKLVPLLLLFSDPASSTPLPTTPLSFGSLKFTPEVASSPTARSEGLMYRTILLSGTGMFFDFCTPQAVQMWMKNTHISLDMVFLDENLKILEIVPNTTPFSLTPLGTQSNVRFVLEVNAGEAAPLEVGDTAALSVPLSICT